MALSLGKDYDDAINSWQIDASGEIDISTAQNLKDALVDSYSEHAGDIILDMSAVNYMDSSGLGVLISIYGDMKAAGHRLVLTELRDNVAKLLKITNLDKVLC
jgi:anti-sigma B factor antagonist